MNFTDKVTIPSTVFAQVVDDEMVILDTESENYFGLDTIGREMWQILVENGSLENLKTTMLEKYEVKESVIKHDIEVFIDTLVKNRLITIG